MARRTARVWRPKTPRPNLVGIARNEMAIPARIKPARCQLFPFVDGHVEVIDNRKNMVIGNPSRDIPGTVVLRGLATGPPLRAIGPCCMTQNRRFRETAGTCTCMPSTVLGVSARRGPD